MELKSGYKQTEVGVIPEQWEVTRLGAHGATYGGLTGKTKRDFGRGEGRFVPFLNVISNVVIDCDQFERVEVASSESQNRVLQGDLLFNGSSETPEEVAFCSVQLAAIPNLFLNSFCFGYRLRDGARVDPLFLAYLFRSRTGREFVKALAQGSTRYNISKKALLSAPLSLPPYAEQRAIAKALSDVDALLTRLDRLIAKKRDVKQAAMQQLLTGGTRLPGFHGEWDAVEFGHIASIRNIKITPSSMPAGTRCVELEAIAQGTGRLLMSSEATGFSSKYTFRRGDVLFGRLRAYLRKYWLATFDGVCSTEIWPLVARDERLFGGFLHLLVQTNDFVNAAGVSYGTHMPRSDWSLLQKLPVRLPPLPEQIAIAAVLSEMDAEVAALEARRDKTRDVEDAMMQELLTGKTRLVHSETDDV